MLTRVRWALVCIVGLAGPAVAFGVPASLPPWQAQPLRAPGGVSSAYAAAVERYASGDRDGAVAALGALPEEQQRREVEVLVALAKRSNASADSVAWRQSPAAAALMLHTDAAIAQRTDAASVRLQESLANELAQALTDDPERHGFARRWYRVMAELALAETRWDDALAWTGRGLDAFPGTAELLLVEGAIEEGVSSQQASRTSGDVFDPSGVQTRANLARWREARQRLERARDLLREAVAAEPALHDARLRLGRVAWRLGDAKQARAAFDVVLSQSASRYAAFLAHLFRGRLDEDAGRLEDAVRGYESALALDPASQSARLALSHARLRLGDPAAARLEAEAALAPAPRSQSPDSYWVYPWGPAEGVESRLEALRAEASSR